MIFTHYRTVEIWCHSIATSKMCFYHSRSAKALVDSAVATTKNKFTNVCFLVFSVTLIFHGLTFSDRYRPVWGERKKSTKDAQMPQSLDSFCYPDNHLCGSLNMFGD